MKEMTICDSETYNCALMQGYISSRRQDDDKQWINDLIDDNVMENEVIYVDTNETLLCKDIHPGNDERFLLIFKDKSLRTIRDLTAEHVPMLLRAQSTVRNFLMESGKNDNWRIFFHYTPSVYQLHAHVSTLRNNLDNSRKHPLGCVIRNLRQNSDHYKHALIMTPLCRALKHLNLYTSVKA